MKTPSYLFPIAVTLSAGCASLLAGCGTSSSDTLLTNSHRVKTSRPVESSSHVVAGATHDGDTFFDAIDPDDTDADDVQIPLAILAQSGAAASADESTLKIEKAVLSSRVIFASKETCASPEGGPLFDLTGLLRIKSEKAVRVRLDYSICPSLKEEGGEEACAPGSTFEPMTVRSQDHDSEFVSLKGLVGLELKQRVRDLIAAAPAPNVDDHVITKIGAGGGRVEFDGQVELDPRSSLCGKLMGHPGADADWSRFHTFNVRVCALAADETECAIARVRLDRGEIAHSSEADAPPSTFERTLNKKHRIVGGYSFALESFSNESSVINSDGAFASSEFGLRATGETVRKHPKALKHSDMVKFVVGASAPVKGKASTIAKMSFFDQSLGETTLDDGEGKLFDIPIAKSMPLVDVWLYGVEFTISLNLTGHVGLDATSTAQTSDTYLSTESEFGHDILATTKRIEPNGAAIAGHASYATAPRGDIKAGITAKAGIGALGIDVIKISGGPSITLVQFSVPMIHELDWERASTATGESTMRAMRTTGIRNDIQSGDGDVTIALPAAATWLKAKLSSGPPPRGTLRPISWAGKKHSHLVSKSVEATLLAL